MKNATGSNRHSVGGHGALGGTAPSSQATFQLGRVTAAFRPGSSVIINIYLTETVFEGCPQATAKS